ncbi:replication-relaxation family protein [Pseudonocardia sp. Cha107L01]|uniref:replication-relaxation family protein n=1 Tax=Pseudonocardia sp. Cha107L01 TaxID=3457576 RepID=UPI00403E4018
MSPDPNPATHRAPRSADSGPAARPRRPARPDPAQPVTRRPAGARPAGGDRGRLADAITEGARLTNRDRQVLALLADHRVMTAEQLGRFVYPNIHRARHRLHLLTTRRVLARFRRLTPDAGSLPYIYTLGQLGAAIHAAAHGRPLLKPSDIADRIIRLQQSASLNHRLGVVDFFTRLHAAAARIPGAELTEWWPEHRIAAACGDLIRPDGYGEWVEPRLGTEVVRTGFFYEHDTGTEKLATLIDKIDRYSALSTTDIAWPMLFELPNPAREHNLHRLIKARYGPRGPATLIATTHAGYLVEPANPAGPIWWSPATSGHRRQLSTLDQNTTVPTIGGGPTR